MLNFIWKLSNEEKEWNANLKKFPTPGFLRISVKASSSCIVA
jgi:hypothetical protein